MVGGVKVMLKGVVPFSPSKLFSCRNEGPDAICSIFHRNNILEKQLMFGEKKLFVLGHPRGSSAKTRGFHTQLDEGPE